MKFLTSWIAAAIVCLILVAVRIFDFTPIQIARLKTFDYLITSLPEKTDTMGSDIIIVEFDEKSIERFGQWPFDRKDIAKVIDKLNEKGAGLIVAPILFSEKDRMGGDDVLARSIDQGGMVLSQTATIQSNKPDAVRRGFSSIGPVDPINYVYSWSGGLPPIKILADAAKGVGTVAVSSELDGVVRRLPLLSRISGNLYPSLVLETIRVAAGDPSYQIKTSEAGIEFVRVPKYPPIATDKNGAVWLTWNTKFDRISAVDIDERVNGKIVILGLAIEGVGGIVATPNGSIWANDIHAHALQTLLDGTSIQRLAYSDALEILALVILLIVLIVVVPRTSVKWTVPVYGLFIGGVGYFCYYMFFTNSQLWDGSYIAFAGTLCFGQLVFNNFAREFRLKQQIKKQFSTYLSPDMVAELQKNPDLLKLGGETRDLTIMFTDVRGFTAISEHYGENVQGLTQIMNRYMTAMTKNILLNNGTLDKYIGDAQMAFWNAPLDNTNHAKHAVKTALEMLNDLDKFNEEVAKEGVPAFGMGIGINSGPVVVGNMGSTQRFDYTCLGDNVNLASRLEGQSKAYGVKLILGENTAEKVKDEYKLAELDIIAVKGKTKGTRIYTVMFDNYEKDSDNHVEFLNLYREQKWDEALEHIEKLRGNQLDEYYQIMRERINELKKKPKVKNWDGVYKATSK